MLFFLAYDHVLLEKTIRLSLPSRQELIKFYEQLHVVIQQKGIKNTEKLNNK